MPQLLGEYECKMDSKGRLRMPSPLLRQVGDEGVYHFVVNRGFENHLMLYPKLVWDRISSEVNQLNTYNRKNLAFIRYFYRGAQEVAVDGADRVLLPRKLLEYAGIEKDVIIFAYNDRMELWAKDQYEDLLGQEPEDFLDLAEEVMGKVRMDTGGEAGSDA
ncbi:MAG: division/cell wall cluster transcriptional repressor MraZ [Saprospiraceae bacterium]